MPDTDWTTLLLDKARRLAAPATRHRLGLPEFSTRDVALVRDEAICERAGRAYGAPGDPPRRVLVVRMGSLFLVYDPYEPQHAGEFDFTRSSTATGAWLVASPVDSGVASA